MIELVISGVVANLELWERSEVLFPSFSLHSFPLPSPSVPSFLLPFLLSLTWWQYFDDIPENQLTIIIDFAFLCKPAWNTLLYTVPPCPDIIWGNGVLPRSPSTTPLLVIRPCGRILQITPYFFQMKVES